MSTATYNPFSRTAAREDGAHEAAIREAGLREAGLREAALREEALREEAFRSEAAYERYESAFDPTSAGHAEGLEHREAPRVYSGRSVEELIPKIVADLGEDAIVLRHERGLTGGFAGFFRRAFVEIEAERGTPRFDRYDDDEGAFVPPQASAQEMPPPASAPQQGTAPGVPGDVRSAHTLELPAHSPDAFAAALAFAEAAEPVVVADMHAATAPRAEPLGETQRELPLPVAPASPYPTTAPVSISSGPVRDAIERALLGFGVDERLTREVLEAAASHELPLIEHSPARPALARAVRRALAQRIPVSPPLPSGCATIALVGPGGSGKSACCAALLDAYHRRSTLPAVCATILAGPTRPGGGALEVVLDPRIPEPVPLDDRGAVLALRGAREEGLLLLDTPPLSPAEESSIRALAAALERLEPDRVVLALPATLGAKPAARLLETYRPLGLSALAITHADETDQLGVAVHVACAVGLAPTYLLEGSGIGKTLVQTDPIDLADRLLPQTDPADLADRLPSQADPIDLADRLPPLP